MSRLGRLVVMGLQLIFEQAFKFVRVEVATRDQAQAVGDELQHVMVTHHNRVLLENLALFRLLNVLFQCQHAIFSRHDQNVVNELEQLDVFLAPVTGALEQAQCAGEAVFDDLDGVADQECAQGGAANGHHLERMPQQQQAAAFHDEGPEHTSEDDDRTNDCEHETPSET